MKILDSVLVCLVVIFMIVLSFFAANDSHAYGKVPNPGIKTSLYGYCVSDGDINTCSRQGAFKTCQEMIDAIHQSFDTIDTSSWAGAGSHIQTYNVSCNGWQKWVAYPGGANYLGSYRAGAYQATDQTCPGGGDMDVQGNCTCPKGTRPGTKGGCEPYTCPNPNIQTYAGSNPTAVQSKQSDYSSFAPDQKFTYCSGGCGVTYTRGSSDPGLPAGDVCTPGANCGISINNRSASFDYCNSPATGFVNGSIPNDNFSEPTINTLTKTLTGVKLSAGDCFGDATGPNGQAQTIYYKCADSQYIQTTQQTSNIGGATVTNNVTTSTVCNSVSCVTTTTAITGVEGSTTTTSTSWTTGSTSTQSTPTGSTATTEACTGASADTLGCLKSESPQDTSSVSATQKAMTYTEQTFAGSNISTCPGGFNFELAGKSFTFSAQPFCEALSNFKFLLLLMATVMAAFIIADGFKV